MTAPSRRETQVEVPDQPPSLSQGAARELVRILRAAAQSHTGMPENGRRGEEPEALAS